MEKYIKKRENAMKNEVKNNYFVCTYDNKLIETFKSEFNNYFDDKLIIDEDELISISFFNLLSCVYNYSKDEYFYSYLLNEFSKDLYEMYKIQNPELEMLEPVEYGLDYIGPIVSEPNLLVEIRKKIDNGIKNNDYGDNLNYKKILGADFISQFPISKGILQNRKKVMKLKNMKKIIDTLITFSRENYKAILIHTKKCEKGFDADYCREILQFKMLFNIYMFYKIEPTVLIARQKHGTDSLDC